MKIKGLLLATAILLELAMAASPVEALPVLSGFSDTRKIPRDVVQNPSDGLALQADTPSPETTGTETSVAQTTGRPMIVVKSYYTEPAEVDAGGNFTLYLEVYNKGQEDAKNLVLSFSGTNFSPLETGGIKTLNGLKEGTSKTVSQSFYVASAVWGYVMEPLQLAISYTDANNVAYSESFNISIHLAPVPYIEPTATPTVEVSRPRLLVTRATTNIAELQPGSQFELFLEITNMGSEIARSVNMVVGGATVEVPSGTDTPGGSYTATGGDFTNFSPLGGSNVQALGDITVGATYTASQPLIVNVTTNPGAYTLKISFVYIDAQGETLVDDQVITLLVKLIPMINISFYREPGDLFAFQPNALPLQIVNIGKKSVILGNMKVTASNGFVENGTMQVGYLDAGGYLTQDAMLTPDTAGEVTITVTVDYVDDFNQPQVISQDLVLNVVEMPVMETPEDGGMSEPINPPVAETFWQKVWRFIKGLVGLDSGVDQNQMETVPEMPTEGGAIEGGGVIIPAPVKGP
ncbi:MAG: hypothetical protein LLG42_13340 [Chloroflexi bacterium]|nr:hypothetical protein [Chloroflexota bacterium]